MEDIVSGTGVYCKKSENSEAVCAIIYSFIKTLFQPYLTKKIDNERQLKC